MRLLKLLFGGKKATPAEQPAENKPAFVTESDVRAHCINTHCMEFIFKNCGRTFNSLHVHRADYNYCSVCSCWLCDDCAGKPCAECNDKLKRTEPE